MRMKDYLLEFVFYFPNDRMCEIRNTRIIYSYEDIPNTKLKPNEKFCLYYRGKYILGGYQEREKICIYQKTRINVDIEPNTPIRTIIKEFLDNPEITKYLTKQPNSPGAYLLT